MFDPASQRLASSSCDGTSRIWELATGRLIGVTGEGYVSQFGSNGLVGLERIRERLEVRRLAPSPVYRALNGPTSLPDERRNMDLSADGRWLASIVEAQGISLWDVTAGNAPQWFEVPGVRGLSFHPQEPRLFLAHGKRLESRGLELPSETSNGLIQFSSTTLLKPPRDFEPCLITVSANGGILCLEN